MDLSEEIAASFGDGPAHRPIGDRLLAGRRVVRRRRVAGATAAAAVLVVVGTTFAAAGPGGDKADPGPAGHPGGTATNAADPPTASSTEIPVDPYGSHDCRKVAEKLRQNCRDFPGEYAVYYNRDGQLVRRDMHVRVFKRVDDPVDLDGNSAAVEFDGGDGMRRWVFVYRLRTGAIGSQAGLPGKDAETFDDWVRHLELDALVAAGYGPSDTPDDDPALVSYDAQGELVLDDGVTITEQVTNPLRLQAPEKSVGLEVQHDGQTFWYLLQWSPDQSSTSSDPADKAFPSLRDWLDDQVALQQGGETLQLVEFAADGSLTPLAGVTLVRQQAGVDVGEEFAPADARTAVAEVRYQAKTWFVLARDLNVGPPEYFPTAASVSGSTLEEFLGYARQQYAGGEGLR